MLRNKVSGHRLATGTCLADDDVDDDDDDDDNDASRRVGHDRSPSDPYVFVRIDSLEESYPPMSKLGCVLCDGIPHATFSTTTTTTTNHHRQPPFAIGRVKWSERWVAMQSAGARFTTYHVTRTDLTL
ncbi:hypothetical protein M0802_002937 [Mischocyttarus mexicanus]|nr:hypothetical protein M0802_002937 [Mischocyttarus mexicanus]